MSGDKFYNEGDMKYPRNKIKIKKE